MKNSLVAATAAVMALSGAAFAGAGEKEACAERSAASEEAVRVVYVGPRQTVRKEIPLQQAQLDERRDDVVSDEETRS
ncbi:MAG: hypothetical protein AAGA09_03995 [Pseudomonadota bacterium]